LRPLPPLKLTSIDGNLESVAEVLGNPKSLYDDGWMASCPAHDDRNPSLSLNIGRDRDSILVYCHAGCDRMDVFNAVRRSVAEAGLFLEIAHSKQDAS